LLERFAADDTAHVLTGRNQPGNADCPCQRHAYRHAPWKWAHHHHAAPYFAWCHNARCCDADYAQRHYA